MKDVFITRTSAFLPLAPVPNDQMESRLGIVGKTPSRARKLILKSNGIVSRHYAIDPVTGEQTMTNAQMTAQAIRDLGELSGPVDSLVTGTTVPDQCMPNHAVMVHGELGWPSLEAVACSGICLSGITALKHAWLSVKAGEAVRVVSTGSDLSSPLFRGRCFEPELEHQLQALPQKPELAFEKDFLRWMLSDGAGAFLLEAQPSTPLSLRINWIDLFSAAHELPVCMYMGAQKTEGHTLRGWMNTPSAQWATQSIFAVKQDVKLLNQHIVRATLQEPLSKLMLKRQLKASEIDWFLPHVSSAYFIEPVKQALQAIGLPIPLERWFTNLAYKGNTGAASPYIMLDELFRSGRIQPGHQILMFVPESGRFSSGFVHMQAA